MKALFILLLTVTIAVADSVSDDLGNVQITGSQLGVNNGSLECVLSNWPSKRAAIRAIVKAKIEALADSNPEKAAAILDRAERNGVTIAPSKRSKIIAWKIEQELKEIKAQAEYVFGPTQNK